MQPYANEKVSMTGVPEYQGPVGGEGKLTTLGDINKRISDINDLIRGATRTAKTGGQEMTAMEKLGLQNEAGKLRDILGRELSSRTGVSPEDSTGLRQGYGKQFEIADTIDAARRARLGQIGTNAEGSSVPTSKTGLLDKAFTKIRGGQQYLADRNFRKAAGAFEPTNATYPEPRVQAALPQSRVPVWTGPATNPEMPFSNVQTGPGLSTPEALGNIKSDVMGRQAEQTALADANKAAAQREVVHHETLGNAAQDAAAGRASRVQGFRASRDALAKSQRDLEGEAARTIGRRNAMNQRSQ